MSVTTPRFAARLASQAGPNAVRRFLAHSASYIDGVIKEAELRERGEVLNVEEFQGLRRENSAVRVCFDLAECLLNIDLPDEVFEDPAFLEVYYAATDMVCWSNVNYLPPVRLQLLCVLTLFPFSGCLLFQHGTSERAYREQHCYGVDESKEY